MRDKVQQLARYYLAELWNNAEFRADWQRVKAAVSNDSELAELWQRVQNLNSPKEYVQANRAILWRVQTALSDFCTRWKLPRVIVDAFENELATPPETRAFYDRVVSDPTAFELQRLQVRIIGRPPTGQVVEIREAEDGGLIAVLNPQLPEPPLKCLPEPMPAAETQSEYIRRVCNSIPLTADASEPETYLQKAIREYRERFPNLHISEGALCEHIEAILKGYYNACAELIPPTRHHNRTLSKGYLWSVAKATFLRVVEGYSWGQIAYTLQVPRSTAKRLALDGCRTLGIEKSPRKCTV